MTKDPFDMVFTSDRLEGLFPADRADRFFEALLGDAGEGAYDIRLDYDGCREDRLHFRFHLTERPGKCLSCSLTYGLPHVFNRHPVINIKGLVADIGDLLRGQATCADWSLGHTEQRSRSLHVVPVKIRLASA